jgi:hypothetical protein
MKLGSLSGAMGQAFMPLFFILGGGIIAPSLFLRD